MWLNIKRCLFLPRLFYEHSLLTLVTLGWDTATEKWHSVTTGPGVARIKTVAMEWFICDLQIKLKDKNQPALKGKQ